MFNLDGLINVVFCRGERLYECTQVLNILIYMNVLKF